MLISILSENKELAQILKRMDSCTFMPSILLRIIIPNTALIAAGGRI